MTEFQFFGTTSLAEAGRIATAGYTPFMADPLSTGYGVTSALGTIYESGSPILAGVNTALVTTNYQHNPGLAAGAHLVADWAGTGRHAIAYNNLEGSSVVGLNLFPADGYGSSTADSQQMIANAIFYSMASPSPASAPASVPEPSTFAGAAFAGAVGLGAMLRRRKQARA